MNVSHVEPQEHMTEMKGAEIERLQARYGSLEFDTA
jgi:hypothetical protein